MTQDDPTTPTTTMSPMSSTMSSPMATATATPTTGSMGATSTPSSGSGGPMEQAKAGAGEVASTAQEGIKTVASDAAEQAKNVAGEVKAQMHQLTQQTTQELRQQAETRSTQAAQGLRSMADQIQALSNGRPEEAASLIRYLGDGQTRLQSLADRLEQRGPQGLMDDVASFARRRPGSFLLYAAGAGFFAGRMIRANQATASQATLSQGAGNGSNAALGSYSGGTTAPRLSASPNAAPRTTSDVWTAEPGTLAPPDASAIAMSDPSWSS